jgi:hypothetical protein
MVPEYAERIAAATATINVPSHSSEQVTRDSDKALIWVNIAIFTAGLGSGPCTSAVWELHDQVDHLTPSAQFPNGPFIWPNLSLPSSFPSKSGLHADLISITSDWLYRKFSISMRSVPPETNLVNKILFRSGETERPSPGSASIVLTIRLRPVASS